MSAVLDLKPSFGGLRAVTPPDNGRSPRIGCLGFSRRRVRRTDGGGCRVTAQQTVLGASANYGKEMERLSAKEALLLAFQDAGGLEALIAGKTSEMQQIDVNERITGLERLNPTPRPTTSPFLEGRWNFEWVGAGSPGLLAARVLARFSTSVASFLGMDVQIKDGYAKATANLKFLNLMESKFTLTAKLSVEGPMRMREDYVEGLLETPKVIDEAIPEQLKRQFEEAAGVFEQLPAPIRDAVANGLSLPLSGTSQRLFMISYLDEEILIIRDIAGAPDVLTRLEGPPAALPADGIGDYDS